jgi:hypothetical protein
MTDQQKINQALPTIEKLTPDELSEFRAAYTKICQPHFCNRQPAEILESVSTKVLEPKTWPL